MKARNKRHKLLMRHQMTLTFAIPVILIFLAVMAVSYRRISESYRTNIEYSLFQTGNQAVSFLESYFQGMWEVSERMLEDEEIASVLSAEDFLAPKSRRQEYEEYQTLYSSMANIGMGSPSFRISIYISDSVGYTANRYYIYPLSELGETTEDPAVQDMLSGNGYVWMMGTERTAAGVDVLATYRALVLCRLMNDEAYGKDASGESAAPVAKVTVSEEVLRAILDNALILDGESILIADGRGQVVLAAGESGELDAVPEELFAETESRLSRVRIRNKDMYLLSSPAMTYSGWRIAMTVPASRMRWLILKYTWYLIPLMLLVILSILLTSILLSRVYTRRLEQLSKHMKRLQEADLNTVFDVEPGGSDEFDRINEGFNYMAERIRGLMQEHYRMGKSVKTSELRALQAQINPHFLYNTLDLINWMAMDFGTTEIAEIAQNLARFYRLSLNRGRSILTIGEEIEHVEVYVNIENFHFNGAIELETEVSPDLLGLGCPNIILQPFVENAIVHGIAEREEITECHIRISAGRDADDVVFRIRDDGPGMTEEQIRELENAGLDQATKGYGVKNINFRLKLYFGEAYGIRYESAPGGGTTVTARIPAMSVEEMEAYC